MKYHNRMLKKENFLFGLFSLVGLSIGFLSTYLLSNYFTVEVFGEIQLFVTLLGILTIFYLPGFDIVITKQIYKHNDNIVKYVLYSIMPYAILPLLIILLSIYFFSEKLDTFIFYAGAIILFTMFDKTTAILNAKLKFKQLRYIEIYTKILILCMVCFVVFMQYNMLAYVILFTVMSTFIIVVRIYYSHTFLSLSNKCTLDKDILKAEGIKTTFSSAYTVIATWSEKLVLGILDPGLLAYFVIGQMFPKVLKDNIKVLLTPTLSTWASSGFEYYKEMIYRYKYHLWGIGIVFYFILFVSVDVLISNFFTKYEESIFIAQMLSISLIFKFVEMAKMSSMALSKHTNVFNKINNKINSVKIVLVIILIPLYGINGAVISILTVEVIRFYLVNKEFSKL